jgi:DNA-binding NtrC family response regulator
MSDNLCRILVVDDDPGLLDVLRMRLEVWGYDVLVAEDALTAARLAAEGSPHVILTDVWLPDVSGVDLLRALTQVDPAPVIILMSAHGSVDLAVESMKHGAKDYLTKPLDYPRLKSLLEEACAGAASQGEE